MEHPKRCFRCIETYAPLGAPLNVWRRDAADAFECIAPLLVPTGRTATSWPSPRAGYPPMRIVDHGDGEYLAVCDEDLSPQVQLSGAAVIMHRADERQLRKLICETLELEIARDEAKPIPGLLRIGSWRPKPAARYPVFCAIATTPAHFAGIVVQALSSVDQPMLLLTPTRAMWSARSEAVTDRRRIMLVPLDEVFEWSESKWCAASNWDAYLGAFLQSAGIRLPDGFSTIRKKTRVAKASATAGKIKAELREWYRGARKHLLDTGDLLPAPEINVIARGCGISPSTAGRWLNGRYRDQDKELRILWEHISDPQYVREYRG